MVSKRGQGEGSFFELPDGRWRAQVFRGYSPRGARLYRTRTVPTKTDARRALRDLQRAQHRGDGPEIGRSTTVKAWATLWLAEHERRVRPGTYSSDAGAVRRWIIPTVGGRRVDQITPADVRSVAHAVETAGRSETTARHAHGVLLRMLRAAHAEGHSVPARALTVPTPASAVSDRDAIPLDDVAAILRVAAGRPSFTRWVVAFFQGIRQAEALGLTWDYVDLDDCTIDVYWQLKPLPYRVARDPGSGFRVPRGYEARHLTGAWHLVPPKSAAGRRVVPLVPAVRDQLAAWRDVAPDNPWGLVWASADLRPGRGDRVIPRSGDADRAEWVALQDAAQVAHIQNGQGRRYTIHEARHTTATLLLRSGVDPHVVTSILGHSVVATSRGYQHVDDEMRRRAMAAIADQLAVGG